MMTFYCPACKSTMKFGHVHAGQKAVEHMSEHDEDIRELITISPRPWIQERLRKERYWDGRWNDE